MPAAHLAFVPLTQFQSVTRLTWLLLACNSFVGPPGTAAQNSPMMARDQTEAFAPNPFAWQIATSFCSISKHQQPKRVVRKLNPLTEIVLWAQMEFACSHVCSYLHLQKRVMVGFLVSSPTKIWMRKSFANSFQRSAIDETRDHHKLLIAKQAGAIKTPKVRKDWVVCSTEI